MVHVTDKAAAALHNALDANSEKDEQVLRLQSSPEGLALTLDEPQEGDQVVTHDERNVLVIAPSIADQLDGATVDTVDSPEGTRLVLQAAPQQ